MVIPEFLPFFFCFLIKNIILVSVFSRFVVVLMLEPTSTLNFILFL